MIGAVTGASALAGWSQAYGIGQGWYYMLKSETRAPLYLVRITGITVPPNLLLQMVL